jgi:hypothetical protein
MLQLVPTILVEAEGARKIFDLTSIQGELFRRALTLAEYFGHPEFVRALIDQFAALVTNQQDEARLLLVNRAGGSFLRVLTRPGLHRELDRFVTLLHGDVLRGLTPAEARERYAATPKMREEWSAILQTQLHVARGWVALRMDEMVKPILKEAQDHLLNPCVARFEPKDYTDIARGYIAALGQGSPESALAIMTELFKTMDHQAVSNAFTTRFYFSRFHLILVEEVVFALRAMEPLPSLKFATLN